MWALLLIQLDSSTQETRRQERQRLPALAFFQFLPQRGMSIRLSFSSSVSFCPSQGSLPLSLLCLFLSKHMPLTITICQSTREKDKGAVTSSVSPAYFQRLVIKFLAEKQQFNPRFFNGFFFCFTHFTLLFIAKAPGLLSKTLTN